MVFFELFSNDPSIVSVAAGAALFVEGDTGPAMYVLTVGSAEVFVKNRLVETLAPGSIVGEMGLISPSTRTATVVASTDCEFVEIDEARFHDLVAQTPHFALNVMRVMAERLRRADQLIPALEEI